LNAPNETVEQATNLSCVLTQLLVGRLVEISKAACDD